MCENGWLKKNIYWSFEDTVRDKYKHWKPHVIAIKPRFPTPSVESLHVRQYLCYQTKKIQTVKKIVLACVIKVVCLNEAFFKCMHRNDAYLQCPHALRKTLEQMTCACHLCIFYQGRWNQGGRGACPPSTKYWLKDINAWVYTVKKNFVLWFWGGGWGGRSGGLYAPHDCYCSAAPVYYYNYTFLAFFNFSKIPQ